MRSTREHHLAARAMRRTLSPPEARLWVRLRARTPGRPAFRRQHPIGPYVADFYCAAARLVIEIDGADHAHPDRQRRDLERDRYLGAIGCRVLRIAAAEVLANPDGVASWIIAQATIPLPP
jgi:very-short-patch-repair endonuclease